jgi:hypothetical protein
MSDTTSPEPHASGLRASLFTFAAAALVVLILVYILVLSPNFRAPIAGGD